MHWHRCMNEMFGEQAFYQAEGDSVKSLASGKWGGRTSTDQEDSINKDKRGVFHNLHLNSPSPQGHGGWERFLCQGLSSCPTGNPSWVFVHFRFSLS